MQNRPGSDRRADQRRKRNRPNGRWKLITAVVAAVVVLSLGVVGYLRFWAAPNTEDKVRATAAQVAEGWAGGKLSAAPWQGTDVEKVYGELIEPLKTAAGVDHPNSVSVRSVTVDGDSAQAILDVTWDFSAAAEEPAAAEPTAEESATDGATATTEAPTPTNGMPSEGPSDGAASPAAWAYPTTLDLHEVDGKWLADFAPALIHPQLTDGAKLEVTALPAKRAPILGADDEELVAEGDVVVVGIESARAENLDKLVDKVAKLTEVDAAALKKRVDSASEHAFVDVITLRRTDYDKVASELQPLPGTVFREETRPLSRHRDFAPALLGSVGQASAEDVEKSQGKVVAGDLVGRSGLQAEFNDQLSGTDGFQIDAVPTAPSDQQAEADATTPTDGEATADPVRLFSSEPDDGTAVSTTIDIDIQDAADKALGAAKNPAALVAIRVDSGEIVAVANGGKDGAGYNRALHGKYPPGSVFKIASSLALLDAGVSPGDTIACPKTTTVNGKSFKNAENHVLGDVTFAEDFAESCNTAFVNSASKVSAKQISAAAAALGMQEDLKIGASAFGASVPVVDDEVEHAASMIGQGKVLSSPLGVATMAASIAAGSRVSPVLIPGSSGTEDAGSKPDPERLDAIRKMMRETVEDGTASALADAPGGPVYGKTGTAEYGSEVPPRTHAWFAGFQDDIAFAVLVEDGGFGAETAVPVAEKFLKNLAG
ncbi:penicillin-binding transpeptidase domain-containing protein [Saxibacter everestensis]|uniref:Penicillin-binding transpeptidase domain-containing protein n=1 Tax=Saxibacter everestensis TaxID=2909229 RepID=A0ABY8QVE7_9MICO|nr:penicillin-binding transpeptidase domain-containing protein [Brevibacteriaceae bacterium ZFBP1038]